MVQVGGFGVGGRIKLGEASAQGDDEAGAFFFGHGFQQIAELIAGMHGSFVYIGYIKHRFFGKQKQIVGMLPLKDTMYLRPRLTSSITQTGCP